MRTIINIKAEKTVKEEAQKTAKELGLSLSTLINAYLKQFIRTKRVYFSLAPNVSHDLERLLGRTDFDISRNKNLSLPASSQKELDKYFTSL
jgi:addiction module RelB/DinJ family antitoxin